jgi:hypothetical protein
VQLVLTSGVQPEAISKGNYEYFVNTSWGRVHTEKLTVAQPIKEIPEIMDFTKAVLRVTIVRQMTPVI